jgi:hypothetical protein
MFRRFRPLPPDDAPDEVADSLGADESVAHVESGPGAQAEPGLSALPIAGFSRRRAAAVMSGVLAAWIVIVFARQVSEASAATARADDIASANTGLRVRVGALERELDLIGRQRYIEQQARGYGLGTPREIAFTLAPNAPALPADAPGSAAVRVGAQSMNVTPLERWLTVLFGPSD